MSKYLNRSELLETEYTSLKIKYKVSDCLKLDTALQQVTCADWSDEQNNS